jgi:malonate transporter
MTEIVTLVVPLFGLILLGALAGLAPVMAQTGRQIADWLLLRLALPALLFRVVATAPIADVTNWSYYFTVAFGIYCAFAIGFTLSALANRGDIRAAGLAGALGSHGALAHLGPALVLPAFGPAASAPLALIYFWDGLIVRILLPILWAIGGRERPTVGEVGRSIARLIFAQPALLAVVAGAVVSAFSVDLPAGIDEGLNLLGSAAAPLGLIGLGLALMAYRMGESGEAKLQFSPPLATKLFLQPVIVYLLVGWVGDFDPAWMFTAVFLAALPPASGIMAIARGETTAEAMDPAAATGLLISIVTITALIALTVQGVIPVDPFVDTG